jgi:MOSC domain-containing protein YiiM
MSEMIIESLNIGLPKKERFHRKTITTGIGKRPVLGSIYLRKSGFDGDGAADLKNHGGLDKAVCVYGKDHYPYWQKVLGTRLPPAAFGENLSVSNLREKDIGIGDVFQIGTAIVQVSQPRQACKTLNVRFGRRDFVKLVADSGFTGFYLRVLEEGGVEVGTPMNPKGKDIGGVSVAFANNIFHHDRKNCDGIETVLAVSALSEAWKRSFQELRQKCD